ncbi:MAG: AIPR family protein, partial [Acidobacteriota bacterium]
GESHDESGNPYNSKIMEMQNSIAAIDDIGRYKYKVVILANPPEITPSKLKHLTGGFPTEVINYERAFSELVFPVISGTFFRATDLHISIDMSNKNAGAKIGYEVTTAHYDCEITALFVPTIEVARLMQRYKNSILLFNPRSYLELDGHKVNMSIRETIQGTKTNEFALFNNGITMLSDETYINERIGQRNKAQLILKNPQIINGGQTAYTLSRILDENSGDAAGEVFEGKEVLLKVITLTQRGDGNKRGTPEQRLDLIDKISTATNQQTPVITADKFSNNQDHIKIQRVLFDRFGIL